MIIAEAKFGIGERVEHLLFGYRGVVLDVDARFRLSEEWYQKNAKTSPPQDAPWYHVLVHDSSQMSYVAEMNLKRDESTDTIDHPIIDRCFDRLDSGRYQRRGAMQ